MIHPDDMTEMATPATAHVEWHLNAGVPMGTPGCPQDACHPVEDYDFDPDQMTPAVKCGNHGREDVHHLNAEAVRRCYAASGRFDH